VNGLSQVSRSHPVREYLSSTGSAFPVGHDTQLASLSQEIGALGISLTSMLILRMRRGRTVKGEPSRLAAFFDELQQAMQPLVKPTRELQAASLGVSLSSLKWGDPIRDDIFATRPRVRSHTWAEAFVLEGGLLVVDVTSSSRGDVTETSEGSIEERNSASSGATTINVSAIMSTVENANSTLEAVSAIAKSALDVELRDHFYRSERFDSIQREVVAEILPETETDILAAETLADRPLRALAVSIKSSRGLLLRDVEKLVNSGNASELVDRLISGGVAAREFVVVCGVSQSQVARVPDKDSLVNLAAAGLRCACGKPIDQESAEDLLTTTDLGALLLDKSRWLSVLVREELVALGVRREDILLECQLGTDEVDCIAQISGEVVIFELKDKEFSMGNAYSFSAKISLINPDYSVIISTDRVASDVKERFSRTVRDVRRPNRSLFSSDEPKTIQYAEGDNFRADLQRAISSIYRKDSRNILQSVLNAMVPDAASVLSAITSLHDSRQATALAEQQSCGSPLSEHKALPGGADDPSVVATPDAELLEDLGEQSEV